MEEHFIHLDTLVLLKLLNQQAHTQASKSYGTFKLNVYIAYLSLLYNM